MGKIAVVGIKPACGHAGGGFDFAGFFFTERFAVEQAGQFALIKGDGGGKMALLAVVVAIYPAAQVVAAQIGGVHGAQSSKECADCRPAWLKSKFVCAA